MIRRFALILILLAGCSSRDASHGMLYSESHDQVCVFTLDGGFGTESVGIPVTIVDPKPNSLGNIRVLFHAGKFKDRVARVSRSDVKTD